MSKSLFSELMLSQAQLDNLNQLGYLEMTPVQAQTLPVTLKGKDVIAQAETGSGKTAAFALGLLQKIKQKHFATQGIIICPTRELCQQVANEVRRLARFQQNIKVVVLCGGQHINLQIDPLEKGAHIVVGTPGRIQDHLKRETLDLSTINTLVLDEADRMLEMGFLSEIEEIMECMPDKKQVLLFSATFPESITSLSNRFQNQPIEIKIESKNTVSNIKQVIYQREHGTKLEFLQAIILKHQPEAAIIFCNMKETAREVCSSLKENGHSALELHGDLEQYERERALMKLNHRSCVFIVATDVAARGLDVKELPMVINYDLPKSPETYVHRIGRTGRDGSSGLAVSIVGEKRTYHVDNIETYLGTELVFEKINLKQKFKEVALKPEMRTLQISAGKKDKVRAGDILGALTGDIGIASKLIGKIDIQDNKSFVAITHSVSKSLLKPGKGIKIKGRQFKVKSA